MSTVTWGMRQYDLNGDGVGATSYNSDTVDEHIYNAFDRTLVFNLNSYDQLTFSLWLDDPRAKKIKRGSSVIKVFRQIDDDDNDIHFAPDNPIFCGVVNSTSKAGADNQMTISVMSPLWRLQSHFHILNHYLEVNPDTDEDYTQSELMWKLIELIEQTFPANADYIGIDKGTFHWGLPDEPQPVPYFVGKGTNTWSNIFEDLMNRPSSPDIIPGYIHTASDPTMMIFNTDEKRGIDHFDGGEDHNPLFFNFHTDPDGIFPPNCDDMTEDEQLNPGEAGNYLWVIGTGGPNAGRYAAIEDASDSPDGQGDIGVYMVLVDRSEVKRYGDLVALSESEFAKRRHPLGSYTVTLSPVVGIYWQTHFDLGDVIKLNAAKGALELSEVKQRIYQITLSMSANNVETSEILVATDFFGKVDTGD